MSEYVTAKEAAKLRHARNEVRHYALRLASQPEKETIIRARYERAIALLVAHKLSGKQIQHDHASIPQPLDISLNHTDSPAPGERDAERQ